MAFQYQHPQFYLAFIAVPAIAVLFWFLIKWKKKAAARIGDQRLVGELTASHSRFLFFLKFVFILISVSALLMAMINPQLPGKMEKVERKGVDVMIALDVSNSMLAEDIKPNRLEKAKQVVMQMMGSLEQDRVGLVLFAGRAYMQMP
ncbi:MAG TPA: VWA domain-containing protein, partial [Flavitalea sp.]|nr:VWA domain-containing protein [Flavitalea sp.]